MLWLIKMQKKFEVFAVASQRIKAGQFSGHPTKNGLVEKVVSSTTNHACNLRNF